MPRGTSTSSAHSHSPSEGSGFVDLICMVDLGLILLLWFGFENEG